MLSIKLYIHFQLYSIFRNGLVESSVSDDVLLDVFLQLLLDLNSGVPVELAVARDSDLLEILAIHL